MTGPVFVSSEIDRPRLFWEKGVDLLKKTAMEDEIEFLRAGTRTQQSDAEEYRQYEIPQIHQLQNSTLIGLIGRLYANGNRATRYLQ